MPSSAARGTGCTNGAGAARRPASPAAGRVRYLPVSTPRPSGDQGSTPRPRARRPAAPRARCRAPAASTPSGRRPSGPARARPAARWPPAAVCQPAKLDTPTYRTRPLFTARSSAASVSSSGVRASYPCTCQRSTWSVPSRRSDASSGAAGGRGSRRGGRGRPRSAGLGRDQQLVARDQVLQQRADHRLGVAVAVDVGGVEQRAAGVEEGVELRGGVVGVGVPAPGHGAEGEPGDHQPAAAERSLLHG